MVDAAELGHDDRADAGSKRRRDLRVRELGCSADALAVVLDEDVGEHPSGKRAVGLPGRAREDSSRWEAVTPEDPAVLGDVGRVAVRAQVGDLGTLLLPAKELRRGPGDRHVGAEVEHGGIRAVPDLRDALVAGPPDRAGMHQRRPVEEDEQPQA